MNIDISGRHTFTVSDMLKEYIQDKISKLDKYSLKIEVAHIVFDVEKLNHSCEIVIIAKNIRMTAVETTTAAQASFDAALHNVENQLRRYHDKIKDHRSQKLDPKGFEIAATDED